MVTESLTGPFLQTIQYDGIIQNIWNGGHKQKDY